MTISDTDLFAVECSIFINRSCSKSVPCLSSKTLSDYSKFSKSQSNATICMIFGLKPWKHNASHCEIAQEKLCPKGCHKLCTVLLKATFALGEMWHYIANAIDAATPLLCCCWKRSDEEMSKLTCFIPNAITLKLLRYVWGWKRRVVTIFTLLYSRLWSHYYILYHLHLSKLHIYHPPSALKSQCQNNFWVGGSFPHCWCIFWKPWEHNKYKY